jgi:type III pantothenate kinase
MMFLAIDIGNTSVSFGLFKKEEPFEMTFRFPTASILSGDHIEDELLPKLVALGDLDSILIASVVPKASDELVKILGKTHKEAAIKVLRNEDIPIINRYHNPSETGTDRLLASLAAHQLFGKISGKPIIVISLGTATTFDCTTETGEYLGGCIALGVGSGAKHLAEITAQLPEIELVFPVHVLGKSTSESIRSGIMFGAVAMIEGMIERLHSEVFPGKEILVVATGGLSNIFEGKVRGVHNVVPHLVLEGIALIAAGNI